MMQFPPPNDKYRVVRSVKDDGLVRLFIVNTVWDNKAINNLLPHNFGPAHDPDERDTGGALWHLHWTGAVYMDLPFDWNK